MPPSFSLSLRNKLAELDADNSARPGSFTHSPDKLN